MNGSELLFYAGVAVMAAAAGGALVMLLVLRATRKRLRKQLEDEFGPRRH